MNIRDFVTHIFPKTIQFRLAYLGVAKAPSPITLTFSVTNKCQSRCKTCNIWRIYPEKHQNAANELSLDEISQVLKSMGRTYFFNVSGGEPFLRSDLPDIVESAVEYLKPAIIHLPTNAIDTDGVITHTGRILEMLKDRGLNTPVTVKPSLDGIGDLHDEIRGVKGNWAKLLKTVEGLKDLETRHDNLHLEIGTVISNFNKDSLDEIEDFVHNMGIQSFRSEIAEQREEFLNIGDPITPTGEEYVRLIKIFSNKIRANLKQKRPLTKTTESLRLVYYDLAAKIVSQNVQVIPCFAGISNVHLTPQGDLWPCCVLGYAKPLGSVRETGYDFWKVWHSHQATQVRQSIKNRECACPLANQSYSNIICHTPSLMKVLFNVVRHYPVSYLL
jgi:MoaA/NifB/PqqE/SkfB family radical SAM enzyme